MDSKARAAQWILGRIFRDAPFGFAARLWDGTTVTVGSDVATAFTVVFRDARAFRRMMLRPNTLALAEAYVGGDMDVEGDFFTALKLAKSVELLNLGLRDRIAIAYRLLRL